MLSFLLLSFAFILNFNINTIVNLMLLLSLILCRPARCIGIYNYVVYNAVKWIMFSLKFVEDNILGLVISRRSKLNKNRYSKPQQFSLMSSSLSSPHFHLTIILTLSLTYTKINYRFSQKLKCVEKPRTLDVEI